MNWYATNLKIFHKAASCTPPNYDLMEHIIVSTLLRLGDFSVFRVNSNSVKIILTNGTKYTIKISNRMNGTNTRIIDVEVCELVGVKYEVIAKENNGYCEHTLLDAAVNMVITRMMPDIDTAESLYK